MHGEIRLRTNRKSVDPDECACCDLRTKKEPIPSSQLRMLLLVAILSLLITLADVVLRQG